MIAVCDEKGKITIHNIHSGTILYKLTNKETQREITSTKFMKSRLTSLYLCSTFVGGKISFFTKPLPES